MRRSWASLTNDHSSETAIASTPSARRPSTASTTSASSSATRTSPSRSTRSVTPRISRRGTIGSGLRSREDRTRSRSGRPATFENTLPIRIASSCPRVVMSPVRAPVRVIIAFVACVVPWTNSSVCPSSSCRERPRPSALSRTASRTPSCSEPGVVSDLDTERPPSSSATTQSVNVPPMSTPMRYLTLELSSSESVAVASGAQSSPSSRSPAASSATSSALTPACRTAEQIASSSCSRRMPIAAPSSTFSRMPAREPRTTSWFSSR